MGVSDGLIFSVFGFFLDNGSSARSGFVFVTGFVDRGNLFYSLAIFFL